jgi:hypothetical protein
MLFPGNMFFPGDMFRSDGQRLDKDGAMRVLQAQARAAMGTQAQGLFFLVMASQPEVGAQGLGVPLAKA